MARRCRRAVGPAEVSLYRVNSFFRLLRYAKPYKGRLAWAVLAMVIYAVASALVIYLIRPILDELLPNRQGLRTIALSLIGLYFLKGVGSYFSGYLMEDVGQRVVMDLRDQLYGHILGQSASFFSRNAVGQLLSRVSNDVGQVQRAVSETAGDLAERIAGARRVCGDSHLVRLAPGDALPSRRPGAGLSAGASRAAHQAHGAPQPGGAGTHVARRRRDIRRSPHRQGLRRGRARGDPLSRRAAPLVSHQHARRSGPVGDASVHGTARRHRDGRSPVVWQRADRRRPAHIGRLRRVSRRAADDVRSSQEAEPRQRESATGDCRSRTHLRDARHPHRGRGGAQRRAAAAVLPGD